MGFIDSYKHLEKLCGDMLQTQHGVSAYIAEMESTPNGSYRVQGWVEDLKCLKHYRWVRNQIVHDPNSSEENMCVLCHKAKTAPPISASTIYIFRTAGLPKKGSAESHWMGCVIDYYSACRTVFCA